MDHSASEPPLVMRLEPSHSNTHPRGMGIIGAVFWCALFIVAQVSGAIVVGGLVFGIWVARTPNPGQFVEDQLRAISEASAMTDSNTDGEPNALPHEIGQSLAVGMLGAQLASFILILVVIPWRVGRQWRRQLAVCRPAFSHVLLILLLLPAFLILTGGLQEFLQWLTGLKPPTSVQSLNGVFRHVPWYVTILAVAIGPGLVEEFWCRGMIGRGLAMTFGLVSSVVLTSVLFAVMHLDPSQVIVIGLMGAYLHFVYLASRSIWVPILLHMLNNGVAIVLVLTERTEWLDPNSRSLPILIYTVAAFVVVIVSWQLWRLRPISIPNSPEAESWSPEYPGISLPPAEANVRLSAPVLPWRHLIGVLVPLLLLISLMCYK